MEADQITPNIWVSGWLDFSRSDNTNILYLIDDRFSQLGKYSKTHKIYRCPADNSMAIISGQRMPRVRSMSMNNHMGDRTYNEVWSGDDDYQIFAKLTDIKVPPPVKAWVMLDEREDSINDGWFVVKMAATDRSAMIVDYPASY